MRSNRFKFTKTNFVQIKDVFAQFHINFVETLVPSFTMSVKLEA